VKYVLERALALKVLKMILLMNNNSLIKHYSYVTCHIFSAICLQKNAVTKTFLFV